MTNFKIFLFIYINIIVAYAAISDQRLCANDDCSEPISQAKTLLSYASNDERILSFKSNVLVKIFSKSAGSRLDLWGAEIDGRRGYVPVNLVKETKIFKSNPTLLRPTDEAPINTPPTTRTVYSSENKETPVQDRIKPNSVSQSYEVLDGTTIYSSPTNESYSTSTITSEITDDVNIQQSQSVSSENSAEQTEAVTPDPKAVLDNLNNLAEPVKITQENQMPINTESTNFSDEDDTETEDDTDIEDDDDEDEVDDYEDEGSVEILKENSVDAALENEVNLSKQSSNPSDDVEHLAHIETSNATVIPDPKEVDHSEIGKLPEISENTANKIDNSEDINLSDVPGNTAEVFTNQSSEAVDSNLKTSTESSENLIQPEVVKNNIVESLEVTSNSSHTSEVASSPNETLEVAPIVTPETTPNMITEETSEGAPNIVQPELVPDTIQTSEATPHTNQSTDDAINTIEPVEVEPSTNTPDVTININTPENANNLKSDENLPEAESNTPTNAVLVENDANVDETNQSQVDESQLVNTPTDYTNFYTGVPSGFENTLNRLPKISEDVLNIEHRDNSQVPSSDPYQQFNPTTESTIREIPLPLDTETTHTENPLSANLEIQEDNKQIEPVSELTKRDELINESVNFDDSTQVIGNVSYAEEINNDLVFDETQTEENVTTTKIDDEAEINEKSTTESTDEIVSDEPGIFSKLYSSIFGASSDTVAVEEEFINSDKTEEVINVVVEDVKEEILVSVLEEKVEEPKNMHSYSPFWKHAEEKPADKYLPTSSEALIADKVPIEMQSCDASQNPSGCSIQNDNSITEQQNAENISIELPENVYSIFLYLSFTAVTVLLFSLGHYYIEKRRKDGTLIASINNLEKTLLITTKECLLAQDELKITKERLASIEDSSFGSNEMVTALKDEIEEFKTVRTELEEQNSNLEKELENATEAGMELNRMLREILSTQSGNEHLMQNIDHLQKQLNEQQLTINTMNTSLGVKNTENELLQTELSLASEKIAQFQVELNKMVVNVLSVQEDKTKSETDYENQIQQLKTEFESTSKNLNNESNVLKNDNNQLKSKLEEIQRSLDLKTNEYQLLKEGMQDVQAVQSNKDSLKALLNVSKVKAEVQQLRGEKHKLSEKLQEEVEAKQVYEKEVQVMMQDVQILKDKFDEAERDKIEAQTRLEVLSSYFNEKEAQLQKEINENESKWIQKEGEATTTIERIKWIQDELQNYKSQNELLKKEILDQEVSLKSQISMLEKKSHDHWLLARQAERRVEESKQEASLLRNRLTIVEKNLNNSSQLADETKLQNRILLPLESNGELPVSPLHLSNVDNSGSPPLLYPHRDHMTTSPPIPGLPLPPFLPPPPGGFMPPPMQGVPPFLPPPPALFPGDHRPPPLGRMSSPPLHGRYSPDSRAYSPYDRDDSPPMSPTYPDSDYRRRSPPPPSHMQRNYSPYHGKGRPSKWDEDRDYRGPPQHRNNIRNRKGPGMSSGSGNSNESLENSGRHSGRV